MTFKEYAIAKSKLKQKQKNRDENGSRVWINILTKYNTHHPK